LWFWPAAYEEYVGMVRGSNWWPVWTEVYVVLFLILLYSESPLVHFSLTFNQIKMRKILCNCPLFVRFQVLTVAIMKMTAFRYIMRLWHYIGVLKKMQVCFMQFVKDLLTLKYSSCFLKDFGLIWPNSSWNQGAEPFVSFWRCILNFDRLYR
jgi:hypothetical protein